MSHQSFFKHDMVPLAVERHDRKKAKQDALDAAYEAVNRRDGNVCRVTGAHLDPAAIDSKARREHHHLAGRRVQPSWREDPARIILVSRFVHDLITKGWITVEGSHAEKPLRFHWTDLATSHPVRIKSRRKSQQERD